MKKAKEQFIKAKKKINNFFVGKDQEVKLVGFKLFEVVVLVSMATIIGVFSGSFITYNFVRGNPPSAKSGSKYIDKFKEAYEDVVGNYYEAIDKDELIDAAINGMLSTLDGYTSYMNDEEEKQFNERMNGEYKGIGIEFSTIEGNTHTVINVFADSPAFVAGVQKGDILVKVDDIVATTKTGLEIASYIKGKKAENITLIVNRNGKEVTLNIKKSLVELPSVTKKEFDKNGKKIGYIGISLFADNTYKQFKDALTSLEKDGMNSLIIDVRNDSGGYLHAADNILELFLAKGDILYKMENKVGITEFKDKTDEKRTYPVLVLINNESASASEILAAGFNESYGSKLVGETTFGKGTVQQPSNLDNGGMIKITTEKWLTPKGNWVNKVGIKPTIEVKLSDTYASDSTDANDNQLQTALEEIVK